MKILRPEVDYSRYLGSHKTYQAINPSGNLDLDDEDMGLLSAVVDAADLRKLGWTPDLEQQVQALCNEILTELFVLGRHDERVCVSTAQFDTADGRVKLWFVKHEDQSKILLN